MQMLDEESGIHNGLSEQAVMALLNFAYRRHQGVEEFGPGSAGPHELNGLQHSLCVDGHMDPLLPLAHLQSG